jgi:hypothetical protein
MNDSNLNLVGDMDSKDIISAIFPLKELNSILSEFISNYFKILSPSIEFQINKLCNLLKEDLICYIEYPYVEKVFRDSFYNYYSTKHNTTIRNCARISFFEKSIDWDHFRNPKLFDKLQNAFYGYFTIRPTLKSVIGRSMISPSAFRENFSRYCLTETQVVVNGVRLNIKGFPHSSQDGDTLTCAETTIWSLMEYFGTKYPEYKPTLPSKIMRVLADFSFERQIPSTGLTSEQICYAIRKFDFGTRLYALSEGKDENSIEPFERNEFKRRFGYYIESGIPIIAAIENDNIGHAIIVMGHKIVDTNKLNPKKYQFDKIKSKVGTIKLYDFSDFIDEYVVVDDNMPPYNVVPFDNPTNNYNDPSFKGCKIKNFVAPLYHKIYLEAGGARECSISYLENFDHGLDSNNIILKLFCISSRSFKVELNSRIGLSADATDILLSLTMPKFIWVGLFTDFKRIKSSKANGFVVFDATETNYEDALIAAVTPHRIITYDSQQEIGNKHRTFDVNVNDFNIFANNLKQS